MKSLNYKGVSFLRSAAAGTFYTAALYWILLIMWKIGIIISIAALAVCGCTAALLLFERRPLKMMINTSISLISSF